MRKIGTCTISISRMAGRPTFSLSLSSSPSQFTTAPRCTLVFRYLPFPHYLSSARGEKANPSGPVASPCLLVHNLYQAGGRDEGPGYHSAARTYRSKPYLSHERLQGAVKPARVLSDLLLLPSCVRILEKGRGKWAPVINCLGLCDCQEMFKTQRVRPTVQF